MSDPSAEPILYFTLPEDEDNSDSDAALGSGCAPWLLYFTAVWS